MKKLEDLQNIGKTLAQKLRSIGVNTPDDLKKMGPVKAYKKLQAKVPQRLPVCYNLYSLEGALRGIHWNELTKKEKNQLQKMAGLIKDD